jgi:hypothetical protein
MRFESEITNGKGCEWKNQEVEELKLYGVDLHTRILV